MMMEDQLGTWNMAKMIKSVVATANNNSSDSNNASNNFWIKSATKKKQQQKQQKKKWIVVSFAVEKVSRKDLFISVVTRRGFFTNTVCLKLVSLSSRRCSLTQTQHIQGPVWRLGRSYRKLQLNLYIANQSFKDHVESQHFQNLLSSTRELHFGNTNTKSSTSMTFDGSSTICDGEDNDNGEDEDEDGHKMAKSPRPSTDFWQTPPELRSELISMFVGGSYKNE